MFQVSNLEVKGLKKPNTEEERWVAALQRGEEAALEEIIRRYTPYAGAVVWGIVGGKLSRADAEEILSDVFVGLWKNAQKLRPGKLKSYLACIARSRAVDALRRAGETVELEEDILALPDAEPEKKLTEAEERRALRETLRAMAEPDRTIFIRHYYLCQKTAEIAEALGMNINTVQTRLKRGREKLRLALTEGGFADE